MPDPTEKPKGKPLPLTDNDLDALTTPEAMQDAAERVAALWRRTAPDEFKNLLDAEETEEGE